MAKTVRGKMGGDHGGEGAPNRWAILITVLVMTFMVCLDSTIVTVALPVMQVELGVSIDRVQWVTSVYLIATCVVMLPFGRMGDRHGKVRMFQAGVVAFTLGSLLCGLSPDLQTLVVARIAQGVGCALAMANNMGIITEAFPAHERGRAMGVMSTFVALGMMAGPVLGGAIVSVFPWEGIFLINVPVGIVSYLVGRRTLPHGRPDAASRDLPLPLYVFRKPDFMVNLATMLIVFVGIGASEFSIPFYLQDARGLSAGLASLVFVTLPLVNAVVGPVSGTISDRIGYEGPAALGLVVYVLGLLSVRALGQVTPLWAIVAAIAFMSLGTSIFQAPNNALFMGSAPSDALGFAGSVSSLARYLGMAVGTMGGSSVLYGVMGVATQSGAAVGTQAFLVGFRAVFALLVAIAALALVLALGRYLRGRRSARQR